MTDYEAMKTYFSKNRKIRGVIQKLINWNEKLDIKQNSTNLFKGNINEARRFKMNYGLKSVCLRNRKYSSMRNICTEAYVVLRSAGWTYEKIAKAFNRTKQAVEQGSRRAEIFNFSKTDIK